MVNTWATVSKATDVIFASVFNVSLSGNINYEVDCSGTDKVFRDKQNQTVERAVQLRRMNRGVAENLIRNRSGREVNPPGQIALGSKTTPV